MRRQLLEFQADRIETVLARHKVSARVTGGIVSPRWVQFQVTPSVGARVNKVKALAEELAMALDCETCRVSRQGGILAVEIPRADPQPVRLLSMQRRLTQATEKPNGRSGKDPRGTRGTPRKIPFGTAVLGLAEDGAPLLIRLPSPQVAHILIAGTTGSGKSALAQTIIASLALSHRPSQLGFILIDPKRRAFGPLAVLPHLLRPVLSEPDEVEQTLELLVRVMLARDREGRLIADAGQPGEPRVVVVIDELADLLMASGAKAQRALTRLAQRGRAAGFHLVACTQKPASQIVGGLAKANFPVRLVGRVTSPEDAKVATGYAGTGAERLHGPGDFVAVSGGQLTHFQAAYISPRELANLTSELIMAERDGNFHQPSGWVDVTPERGSYLSRKTPVGLSSRVSSAARLSPPSPIKRLTDGVRDRLRVVAQAERY